MLVQGWHRYRRQAPDDAVRTGAMMAAETSWIITVDDAHLHRLDEVVEELRTAGLQIDRVLRSLGQVTGRTELARSPQGAQHRALAEVTGVETVDTAHPFSIGPPDAEIQ